MVSVQSVSWDHPPAPFARHKEVDPSPPAPLGGTPGPRQPPTRPLARRRGGESSSWEGAGGGSTGSSVGGDAKGNPLQHPVRGVRLPADDYVWITLGFRGLICLGLVCGFAYYDELEEFMKSSWKFMRKFHIFRHDSFEPVEATLVFAFWVSSFRLFDAYCPFLHRFRISSNPPATEKLYSLTNSAHGMASIIAYLLPLLVFDFLFPRRSLTSECPSPFAFVLQLIGGIFVYDLLFYFPHFAFHKFHGLYGLHQRHHTNSPLRASEAVMHSLPDGALQVAANILALHIVRSHPLTRTIHNVVITYMLTELHCGYDFPWGFHRVLPFGIYGGPPRHELHHAHGTVYYQQFFTYLDHLTRSFYTNQEYSEKLQLLRGRPPKGSHSTS